MTGAALARFSRIAARTRAALWPATVLHGSDTDAELAFEIAKSPSSVRRVRNVTNSGWIQQAECSLFFGADTPSGKLPTLGARYKIHALPQGPASEVGTVWQVRELYAGVSGVEHRAVCVRVDT